MVQIVFDYISVHITLENLYITQKVLHQSHFFHPKFASYLVGLG
jgi:hypothetical protein